MTQVPGSTDPFGRPAQRENSLGLAGFICSLVGLMSCGVLSPIGMILSLIGLKREPKGFAIAGSIIGGVGSCGIIVGLIFFLPLVLGLIAAIGLGGPKLVAQIEMASIRSEVLAYRQRTGQLPASLALLPITDPKRLTDQWGNTYVLTPGADGVTFELSSNGPDGLPGTADDIKASTDFDFSSDSTQSPSSSPTEPAPEPETEIPDDPSSSATQGTGGH